LADTDAFGELSLGQAGLLAQLTTLGTADYAAQ